MDIKTDQDSLNDFTVYNNFMKDDVILTTVNM